VLHPERGNPSVFISYSHDTPAHEERVLGLADRLTRDGITCYLDQYEEAPPEGWPRWMERHVREDDFVLIVCTETYIRRVRLQEEPGKGQGVKWESMLSYNHLYQDATLNTRLLPIIFERTDTGFIPDVLQGSTHYYIATDPGYATLYRRLTGQHEVPRPPLGQLKRLPPRPRGYSTDLGAAEGPMPAPSGDEAASSSVPSHSRQSRPQTPGVADGLPVQLSFLPEEVSLPQPSDLGARVRSLLVLCEATTPGLPLEVLAATFDVSRATLVDALSPAVQEQTMRVHGDTYVLAAPLDQPAPPPGSALLIRALETLLAYSERHREEEGARTQLYNAAILAKRCLVAQPSLVAQVFARLDKPLKNLGDKRLVLDVAKLSVQAARRPGRTMQDVQGEAHALICGCAWVYQRIDELEEAVAAAHTSLELGEGIGWRRNTAFCKKCIGRLYRLEAEKLEGEERARKITASVASLNEAIALFDADSGRADTADAKERGDCYSLLGRTYLLAHRTGDAAEAIRQAERLIPPDTDKDYIDLIILKGDLRNHQGHDQNDTTTLDYYNQAIALTEKSGPAPSEVSARAYMARAQYHRSRHSVKRAVADFSHAAEIYQSLEEREASARAQWQVALLKDDVPRDARTLLEAAPAIVRMAALAEHTARLARLPARARGPRRSAAGDDYWSHLINTARTRATVATVRW